MPEQQNSALSVRELSLTIGDKAILNNISFDLNRNQILGVLGPNGAGKTSLLKMLCGQTESHGQVSWNNHLLSCYSVQKLAQQIAVVNQINDTVFAVTLQQVVRMGLLPHKSLLSRDTQEDKHLVEKALNAVGLSHKAQQTFSSLSGGEQQRGLIAKALVQRAPLLILDEPINHLDVFYQHQILQLVHELAKKLDITVVMSLHDLNLAASYCDQLCLLNEGNMEAFGAPIDVLKAPRLTQIFKLPCSVEICAGDVPALCFTPDKSQLFNLQDWQS